MSTETDALRTLGELLRGAGYSFVTVTPETHRRVNARAAQAHALRATDLRDVFGWNRPFERELLPASMFECLAAAGALEQTQLGWRSQLRFATVGELLCVHSGFPTLANDAVFFGPDTYRFCNLLARWAPAARRAVDVGCGSGAGGLSIAERVQQLVLADINPRALSFAAVNAGLAQRSAEIVHSDILAGVQGDLDLIIANPPYMHDEAARVYRDGGGMHGAQLSVRIVREALQRLAHDGTLILYTGAPIVAGRDLFYEAVRADLAASAGSWTYEQLDPDVFGEELDRPGYAAVERIAVVGLRMCLSRSAPTRTLAP